MHGRLPPLYIDNCICVWTREVHVYARISSNTKCVGECCTRHQPVALLSECLLVLVFLRLLPVYCCLRPQQVQASCTSWLSDVASSCASHGLVLLQQCSDAPALLQAEAAVHAAITEWTSTPPDDAASSQQQDPAAAAGAAAAAGGGGSGSQPATAGSGGEGTQEEGRRQQRLSRLGATPPGSPAKGARGRVVSEWELTCLAVVGRKVDLWQVGMGEQGRCVVVVVVLVVLPAGTCLTVVP